VLRDIRDTQAEHLASIKSERMLKEVLFQLTELFEDMIEPDDAVARLALARMALKELDARGLDTTHLSDLSDKREFSRFIKTTQRILRDTAIEVASDIDAFEELYSAYRSRVIRGFDPFKAEDPPKWLPQQPPAWSDRQEPDFSMRPLPAEPTAPSNLSPPPFPEWPTSLVEGQVKTASGGTYWPRLWIAIDATEESITGLHGRNPDLMRNMDYLLAHRGEWVALNPDNGRIIRIDRRLNEEVLPSAGGTDRRFPLAGFIESLFSQEAEKNRLCRRYESELRAWSRPMNRYLRTWNGYREKRIAWEKKCGEVTLWNDEMRVGTAELSRMFREEEKQRRDAYEAALIDHQRSEEHRHRQWQQDLRVHEARHGERLAEWQRQWITVGDSLRKLAEEMNAFLAEHPDLQVLFERLDVEKDLASIKNRAAQDNPD
jgi:hypothetical protein